MTTRTNLLPIDLRCHIAVRKILTTWGFLAGAVLAVACLDISLLYMRLQSVGNAVEVAQANTIPLQQFFERNAGADRQRQALVKRLDYLESSLPNDDVLQTLATISTAVFSHRPDHEPSEQATETTPLRIANLESLMISAPFQGLVTAVPHMELRAKTIDDSGTVRLVENLRKSDRLRQVTLKGSGRNQDGDGRFVNIVALPYVSPGLSKP